jgi:hypothetical protein
MRPVILGVWMDQDREDYREPGPPPPLWPLRIAALLLAAAALVGVGIVGTIAYFMIHEHFAG